ncbi:hypothetical protein FACS1894126_1340 [Alphaproteobacteria bacterium]|jgi:hypothetical protein|nr:hypothetical protein FACS1894126_1340 [Alphaproteobacteria bacterium]
MKAFTPIFLAFSTSLLAACAGSGKNILEQRAGYGEPAAPGMDLGGVGDVQYVPTRVPEKVVVAWLHAHELPTKDYFWGSWLSIVAADETWEMVKITPAPSDPLRTPARPSKGAPKKKVAPAKKL